MDSSRKRRMLKWMVFDKEKRKPTHERDSQSGKRVGNVQSRKQPGQGVIDNHRSDNGDHVRHPLCGGSMSVMVRA